jgi:hypothetical protein
VNAEADVGGDETTAGDEREYEARGDYLFHPLGVRFVGRRGRSLATGVLSAGCFVTDLARFTVFGYGG